MTSLGPQPISFNSLHMLSDGNNKYCATHTTMRRSLPCLTVCLPSLKLTPPHTHPHSMFSAVMFKAMSFLRQISSRLGSEEFSSASSVVISRSPACLPPAALCVQEHVYSPVPCSPHLWQVLREADYHAAISRGAAKRALWLG